MQKNTKFLIVISVVVVAVIIGVVFGNNKQPPRVVNPSLDSDHSRLGDAGNGVDEGGDMGTRSGGSESVGTRTSESENAGSVAVEDGNTGTGASEDAGTRVSEPEVADEAGDEADGSKPNEPSKALNELAVLLPNNGSLLLKYFWKANCPECDKEDVPLQEFLSENVAFDYISIDIDDPISASEVREYTITSVPAFVVLYNNKIKVRKKFLTKAELEDFVCVEFEGGVCPKEDNRINIPNPVGDDLYEMAQSSPVLEYFWSPYCPSCEREKPELQRFLSRHPGLKYVQLDVRRIENRDEIISFEVTGTPTHVIRYGDIAIASPGAKSYSDFSNFICPIIKDDTCVREGYT